jgi:hypothetical protein
MNNGMSIMGVGIDWQQVKSPVHRLKCLRTLAFVRDWCDWLL